MDIPAEIKKIIEKVAEKRFPILHLSQNAPANSRRNKRSFIEGAMYWYRHSQKHLEEKDKEIARLKELIKDAYDIGYDESSWQHDEFLKQSFDKPQSFEDWKKENNI